MAIAGIEKEGILIYRYVLILVRAANNIIYIGKKVGKLEIKNLRKSVLM